MDASNNINLLKVVVDYSIDLQNPVKCYLVKEEQEWQVDAMRKWCDEAGITHTPTIFINGKRLPEKYIPMVIRRKIDVYFLKIFSCKGNS